MQRSKSFTPPARRVPRLAVGLLGLAAAFGGPAHAERYVGASAYAATSTRFPCDRYLKMAMKAQRPAMSILWNTFGKDMTCTQRFLDAARDRPHLLQIHFSNEACRRKNNCETDELLKNHSVGKYNEGLERHDDEVERAVIRRIDKIRDTFSAMKNGSTKLMLSTGLEDQLTTKAYLRLLELIQPRWPYAINRNPVGAGVRGNANTIERHTGRGSCSGSTRIVNEDGELQSNNESKQFLERGSACFASFLWRKDHQGHKNYPNPTPGPRRDRNFEISAEDVRALGRLLARY